MVRIVTSLQTHIPNRTVPRLQQTPEKSQNLMIILQDHVAMSQMSRRTPSILLSLD